MVSIPESLALWTLWRDHVQAENPDMPLEAVREALKGFTSIEALIESTLLRAEEEDALAEALKARMTQCAERKRRLEDSAAQKRRAVADALAYMECKSLPFPEFTAIYRAGSPRVEITDLAAVPAPYIRETIKREPDKAEIKKALQQGKSIQGCCIVVGDPSVNLRKS